MQNFRDSFQYYLMTQEIKISDLSHITGIDRSTLYHYQRGSRIPPDMKTVLALAQALRISGTDLQRFKDAYEVSLYGEYVFVSRKQVRELLFDLSEHYPVLTTPITALSKVDLSTLSHLSTINGESAVDAIIETILASGKDTDPIYIMEPLLSDNTIRAIQSITKSIPGKRIVHLVTLENRSQLTSSDSVYNLHFLNCVLPLLLDENNYECYFQYGDISTIENQVIPSCFVMSPTNVIAYTNNHRSGILYCNEQENLYFHRLFEECISSARLFNQKPKVGEVMTYYTAEGWPPTNKDKGSYFFDIGLCSACVISREKDSGWIDLLAGTFENADVLTEQFLDYCQFVSNTVRDPNNNWIGIFTKQGIDYFCDTGILVELYFVSKDYPLPVELRAELLSRWLEYVEMDKAVMVDFQGLSGAMAVAITPTPNKTFVDVPSTNGYSSMAVITESSLVLNLYDYFADLAKKAISKQQTIAYLKYKLENMV